MKLFRFGKIGNEKPNVIINEILYDVSQFVEDYNEYFFESGGIEKLNQLLIKVQDKLHKIPENSRIASCVARPSKIVCIGLNFADHTKESGAKIPKEPIVFFKSTTSLPGPYVGLGFKPLIYLKEGDEMELGIEGLGNQKQTTKN